MLIEIKEEEESSLESYSVELSVVFLEEIMSVGRAHLDYNYAPEFIPEKHFKAERNLLAAVLGHAFMDLQETRPYKIRVEARKFLCDEELWGRPAFEKYFLRARNICEQLDLDFSEIRRKAERMFHNPTKFNF